jgi:uncharacterized protein (TIGR03435 family)
METMPESDHSLIAEFNARRSEAAFAALVRQHVNLVFATAMRQVGNRGAAEEITQNVFVALAQSAGKLGSHPTIAGWLHQTALNKSREWLRSELRRRRREQVAVNLQQAREEGDSVWSQLVPLLDEALMELREPDRLAVILHFMEGQTFHDVGSAIGVGEDAARKRVNRCLDQLTQFFRRRGFALPAFTAGVPLFALSSHVAPAGLAVSATTAGLAAHSTVSTLTLIKGALKIMAWTQAKTAIVVGVGVLLAAGTITVTVKKIEVRRAEESWRFPDINTPKLMNVAPQVKILPTKFPNSKNSLSATPGYLKWVGINEPATNLVWVAYGWPPGRIIYETQLPQAAYDFVATLSSGSQQALQNELKAKLGLVGRRETKDMDVLLLKVRNPNAQGLMSPQAGGGNGGIQDGHYDCQDAPISDPDSYFNSIVSRMEDYLGVPVIDETGLTQHFSFKLNWNESGAQDPNHDVFKKTLLDQLGLELVSTNMPIEMLVVEKAK